MPKLIALLALAFVCAGCQTRVTRYSILSTRQVDVSRMQATNNPASPVDGKAGSLMLGKIPLSVRLLADEVTGRSYGNPHIDRALDRALAKSPGAVALADVVLYDTQASFPFLWDFRSCTVKGRPVVVPPPATQPEQSMALAADQPLP
jgi:hypothetical protein